MHGCSPCALQDKKRRQYVITALSDTKVDLKSERSRPAARRPGCLGSRVPQGRRSSSAGPGLGAPHPHPDPPPLTHTSPPPLAHAVLSTRLGTGKGGLSWGSEEMLQATLQVEPGCVTPLALASPSAADVLLLLDSKLRDCGRFFVHPIVNTASVCLDAAGLEAFLRWAAGRVVVVAAELGARAATWAAAAAAAGARGGQACSPALRPSTPPLPDFELRPAPANLCWSRLRWTVQRAGFAPPRLTPPRLTPHANPPCHAVQGHRARAAVCGLGSGTQD